MKKVRFEEQNSSTEEIKDTSGVSIVEPNDEPEPFLARFLMAPLASNSPFMFKKLEHLAPNSVRLEVSKKVLLVHVCQGAAKLQAVKLFSFFKNLLLYGSAL